MAWREWTLHCGLLMLWVDCLLAGQQDEGDLTVVWPSSNPEIYLLHVTSHIRHRYAQTHVTAELANHGQNVEEAVFDFWIPKEAFITNFTMEINGKLYEGEVKEMTQARKTYHHSGSGKLQENTNSNSNENSFRVTVGVAAEGVLKFKLTYEEVLRRKRGKYSHMISLHPGQVIRDLAIDVDITESRDISSIRAIPLGSNMSQAVDDSQASEMVVIRQPASYSARVSVRPTVRQQLQYSPQGMMGYLAVEYDLKRHLDAGELIVGGRYLAHFFAPVELTPLPKDIFFILDSSGSMEGAKMAKVKDAMDSILDKLLSQDMFNVITFSTWLQFWSPEGLLTASRDNRAKAKEFIRKVNPDGGTNINDALLRGLELMKNIRYHDNSAHARVPIVVFLTDGKATSGITNPDQILTNIRASNKGKTSIFSLALGDGVNWQFMQKMAQQNNGFATKINEEGDITQQIKDFYDNICTPLLANVRLEYPKEVALETSLTRSTFPAYFEGTELVVLGELYGSASALTTSIHADALRGHMSFDAKAQVRHHGNNRMDVDVLERMWAHLTIKKLLNTILETSNATVQGVCKTRALGLALMYSFVMPMTTMVVTQPGQPHTNMGYLRDAQLTKTPRGAVSGRRRPNGVGHRTNGYNNRRTSFVDNDPHFLVAVSGIDEAVCFDIDGKPGNVFQLIYDKNTGVVVNGLVVGKPPSEKYSNKLRTYFGEIFILTPTINVTVTSMKVKVNDRNFRWKPDRRQSIEGANVHVSGKRNVTIQIGEGLIFTVLRHKVKRPHPTKVDFLGFYVEDGRALSTYTHGLIGQFQHQYADISDASKRSSDGYKLAYLNFKGPNASRKPVRARLRHRRNMELRKQIECWHVGHNGEGLIYGEAEDYIVPSLTHRGFSMQHTSELSYTFPLL